MRRRDAARAGAMPSRHLRGHLAMSRDIFSCHNCGAERVLVAFRGKGREAAKHPTGHRTAPNSKE